MWAKAVRGVWWTGAPLFSSCMPQLSSNMHRNSCYMLELVTTTTHPTAIKNVQFPFYGFPFCGLGTLQPPQSNL